MGILLGDNKRHAQPVKFGHLDQQVSLNVSKVCQWNIRASFKNVTLQVNNNGHLCLTNCVQKAFVRMPSTSLV